MTDTDIYNIVENAFAVGLRPAHFTNYWHCSECKDHDDTLCSKSADTLTLAEVGNLGWDPICFITPEGMQYYFPALVRLALTPNAEPDLYDPYIYQFLRHVSTLGGFSKFSFFTQIQKAAVLMVLKHILEHHTDKIEDWSEIEEDLRVAIIRWEEFVVDKYP